MYINGINPGHIFFKSSSKTFLFCNKCIYKPIHCKSLFCCNLYLFLISHWEYSWNYLQEISKSRSFWFFRTLYQLGPQAFKTPFQRISMDQPLIVKWEKSCIIQIFNILRKLAFVFRLYYKSDTIRLTLN